MAERIKMGLVGCGGMVWGAHGWLPPTLVEGKSGILKIVAACDIAVERAEERANQAHEFQGGTKPAVYAELDEMWRSTLIWSALTSVPSTVHIIRSPFLRSTLENMLLLKSRSVLQCGMQTDDGSRGSKRQDYFRR